jgi:hypothetical protein
VLQPLELQALYDQLLIAGRRDGTGGLHPRTVGHVHRGLHRARKQAAGWHPVARRAAQRQLERRLARKGKGSANRAKARVRVATAHRKVRDRRADHHHKLALRLIRENQVVAVEDVCLAGLGRIRLAKSVHDAGEPVAQRASWRRGWASRVVLAAMWLIGPVMRGRCLMGGSVSCWWP